MFIARTFPTTAGPRLASHPALLAIPCQPADALASAAKLDRQADLHLFEGRAGHADRLSHLALELRCRTLGGRA